MDVVYQAANLIDAHLVRIAPEQAGIPAFVRGWPEVGALVEALPLVASAVEVSAERPWPARRPSGVTTHAPPAR